MPRNGVGNYVLPPGQPVVAGTIILDTVFNALMADLADALSASIASDGQKAMAAVLPMSGNRITNLGAGVLPGDAIRFDQAVKIADLASTTDATKGTAQIGWFRAITGFVGRKLSEKVAETVSVKDFGASGDGVTNDSAAFLAAALSLGAKGGTVQYFDKHLIDASFTLPKSVTLRGPMYLVGSPGTNTVADYSAMAALIVNPAATISLSSGSGHTGGLVYRKGMSFPATDSSAFAGTPFTVAGDDTFLTNSLVGGFALAYKSSNFARPQIFNNNLDNLGGIEIAVCLDISRVHDNHAWPFMTIAALGPATSLQRSGAAYLFHDVGDWNKSTNNFSYGYLRGHQIINCNSMTLLSVSADNTTVFTGSIGIEVLGTSTDTRIVLGQAAAQDIGIHINTSADTHTSIVSSNTWVNTSHGLLIDGGDVTVIGGAYRNSPQGITVNNSASKVFVDGVRFNANSGAPISCNVATTNLRLGINDYGNLAVGVSPVVGSLTLATIASSLTLALPATGSDFLITGSTSFGTITGGFAGRKTLLYFSGAPVVFHSIGANGIKLNGNANFSTAANSTLSLIHNGTQWLETGRSL